MTTNHVGTQALADIPLPKSMSHSGSKNLSRSWTRWSPSRGTAILLLSVSLALFGIFQPPTASAQTEQARNAATARELFRLGVNHALRDEFELAASSFSRAYAIHPAPAIAYNWAAALERLGRLVEASELAREVVRDRNAETETRQSARDLYMRVRDNLGEIRIAVEGDTSNVRILLDGGEIPPAALGAPVPVDPGAHTLAAARNGEILVSRQAQIEDGAHAEITLEIPEASARSAPEIAVAPSPTAERRDDGGNHDLEIAIGIGAAALAIAGGVTLAVVLASDSNSNSDASTLPGAAMPTVLEWN